MSQWLGMECPYQDDNICRIMGYLYSEEFASLYHDAEPDEFLCDDLDESNRTTESFKESYMLECFEVYDRLEGLEYLPEPTDSRILSAVDSTVVDHDTEWRSAVMGYSPDVVRPVSKIRRKITPLGSIITYIVAIFV